MNAISTSPTLGPVVVNFSPPPVPRPGKLCGRYGVLEPLAMKRHADSLFEAFTSEPQDEDWTFLPYGPFATLESFRAWVARCAAVHETHFYALLDPTGAQALGVASYLRIQPLSASIEVGHIHFSRAMQRTAAATEALFLLIDYAFSIGYRRMEWKCDARNLKSRRAALRLGFAFEGIFRQATVVKQRNRDTAWFAIMDHEWPKRSELIQQWLAQPAMGANLDQDSAEQGSLEQAHLGQQSWSLYERMRPLIYCMDPALS